MRIQVIGETIKSIDDKTKGTLFSLYPDIPWKKSSDLETSFHMNMQTLTMTSFG